MNSTDLFSDLKALYLQTLKSDMIFYFVTVLLLVLLIVQFVLRKHRSYELSVFFRMCLCDLFMVFVSMACHIAPVFGMDDYDTFASLIYNSDFVLILFEQILSGILMVLWLIYMEYTLHKSRDLIRRRYKPAVIPVSIALVLTIVRIPVLFLKDASFDKYAVYSTLSVIAQIILLSYLVAAYVILYKEKKRNRLPEYVRLTPTTLCMFLGFVLELILSDYPFTPLFFAIGLMFADYFMYRRLRCIDPETGLFNRKYIPTITALSRRQKLRGATVIRFRVHPDNAGEMASILKQWEPDLCKTIIMDDGLFLMVSQALNDSVAKRFTSLFTEYAGSKGITVESAYKTDHEALIAELLREFV